MAPRDRVVAVPRDTCSRSGALVKIPPKEDGAAASPPNMRTDPIEIEATVDEVKRVLGQGRRLIPTGVMRPL